MIVMILLVRLVDGVEGLEVHEASDLLILSCTAAVASAALYFSGLVETDDD